jgi:hypothetical protein
MAWRLSRWPWTRVLSYSCNPGGADDLSELRAKNRGRQFFPELTADGVLHRPVARPIYGMREWVALGQGHDSQSKTDGGFHPGVAGENILGAAATDVERQERSPLESKATDDAEHREASLVLPTHHPDGHARLLLERPRVGRAVGGLTDRAGCNDSRRRRPGLTGPGHVAGHHGAGTSHRSLGQTAGGGETLAQPRHFLIVLDDAPAAGGIDLHHEQPNRIGTEVDAGQPRRRYLPFSVRM